LHYHLLNGIRAPISAWAAIIQYWPLSNELCVTYGMTISLAGINIWFSFNYSNFNEYQSRKIGIASITTLAFLALWRLTVVIRGLGLSNVSVNQISYSFHRSIVISCLIWGHAIAITCLQLFGWGQYGLEPLNIT